VFVSLTFVACAAEHREQPIDPASVSIPHWATTASASATAFAAREAAPVALGSDHDKPRHASGKRIDLDVVAVALPNLCRLIGELAGVNIVVGDEVTGTVTVKMKNVPWDEALDAILLSKGYRAERVGSVVIVRK